MGIDKGSQQSIIPKKKEKKQNKTKPWNSFEKLKKKNPLKLKLFVLLLCCLPKWICQKIYSNDVPKVLSFLCFLVSYVTEGWFMVTVSTLRLRTSGNCEKEREGFGHRGVECTHSNKAMQSQDHLPLFLWGTLLSINTHLLWCNVQIKSFLKTLPSQLVEQCQ